MEKIHGKIISVKKLVTENKDLYGSINPQRYQNSFSKIKKLRLNPR